MVNLEISPSRGPSVATPTHSQFDSVSLSSLDKATYPQPEGAIHVSQSHTNLMLIESSSERGEPVFKDSPAVAARRRSNLSFLLDPSLMALLNEVSGLPLSLVDHQLQAIKAVLDNFCSKYTPDWEGVLGDSAKSLFHSVGGWKALVLKLHQVVAEIVLPQRAPLATSWSNAWETVSLLSHVNRMQVNPGRVQDSLSRVSASEASIPLISVKLNESSSHEISAQHTCSVDLQIVWYAVQCAGRFDVYLQGLLASQLKALRTNHALSLGNSWEISESICEKSAEIFQAAQFRHRLFSEQYEWYLLMLSQQGSAEGIEATLRDIETDLRYSNFNPCDASARRRLERLLVQMIGHTNDAVRSTAVRLMNRFYDTHDWQRESAFDRVEVVTVGDDLVIPIPSFSATEPMALELVGPPMSPEPLQRETLARFPLTRGTEVIRFSDVSRSGFYDFRIVKLTSSGWKSVKDANGKPEMGRFIVQPRNARNMQVCSVLVDEVGSFGGLTSRLDELVDIGFSAVHVEAAGARDNGRVDTDPVSGSVVADRPSASAWAMTDRASPCELFGGRPAFSELTATTRSRNLQTLIDLTATVSSTHKHRKYKDQHLFFIDERGVKRLMSPASEAACLLNYRLLETWELLIADALEWPERFGVSGTLLKGAAQWPPLLTVDTQEMLRMDPDGAPHYSNDDIMAGSVVTDAGSSGGYWGTEAERNGYANPLLLKLTREAWNRFPNFLIVAEVDDIARISSLVKSGVIPVVTGLALAAAPLFKKQLSVSTGRVVAEELTEGASAVVVAEFVNAVTSNTPKGAVLGLSSVYKQSPLPAALCERGRAAFTDLMMTLPFAPFLRFGEYECSLARLDSTEMYKTVSEASPVAAFSVTNEAVPLIKQLPRTSSFAAILSERAIEGIELGKGGFLELDPVNCMSQYEAWMKLRRRKAHLFTSGDLRILECSDPMVVAFAREYRDRLTGRVTAIVGCVNFGSHDSLVDINLTLRDVVGEEFMVESDLFKSGPKTPWSRTELESSVLKLVVPQFNSVFRLFKSARSGLSGRFMSDLLVASLRRNGDFLKSQLRAALSSTSCEGLHALINKLVTGGVDPDQILPNLVAGLSEEETVKLMAKFASLSDSGDAVAADILASWRMGPIMFTTPELGKWSTYGGLGVMIDDLINTLSPNLHSEIWVCSPYYERNRKGETGYLAKDGIAWSFNIEVDIGIERVTVGVFEAKINGIRHFFLHNAKYFPSIYPDFQAGLMTGFLALMAKCPLEICCHLRTFPSSIVTNDWATGLTAAYAKRVFGSVFSNTKFMHIVHNLDQNYEGRIFPQKLEDLGKIHMLPADLLTDPHWQRYCLNPSRCALMSSDNWGTVSVSYRKELLEGSPLSPLLRLHAHAFAHPNGIPTESRLEKIAATGYENHWDAKAALQRKYFKSDPNPNAVLIAFVGRITFQKGIHLILDIAEQLLRRHAGGVQILIGGAANPGEQYAQHCAVRMRELTRRFPSNFWSDPDAFFLDGPLVNLGADFGLMPSAFEPGGIVQQEFMVAGTPVIAFKTGGLRDTISEFFNGGGNGFTFEAHTGGDLAYAVERAIKLFWGDKRGYDQLRENARASVITCDMVARAWLRELYRMCGKVYVDLAEVARVKSGLDKWKPSLEMEMESEPESVDLTTSDESQDERFSSTISTPTSMASRVMSRDPSVVGIVRRSVRVTFKPKLDTPRSVLLAGSFDQWASRIPLKWDKTTRAFFVDVRVPQGKWHIKLIVDGLWTCIDEYPSEKDVDNNINNVILVD